MQTSLGVKTVAENFSIPIDRSVVSTVIAGIAISDFLEYLRSTQKSETTIAVYLNDLQIAMVWCLKHNGNKPFPQWTKRDIISFQNWLVNENENSPARVRRIKATLSSMSNYIEAVCDDEYPEFRNLIHKVASPVAQPVREKTVLTDEQLDGLLEKLSGDGEHEKACMLALAMCSGRRKSELVRFKTRYFDEENIIYGSLYKTPETVKTKGHGKGKFLYCYTLAKKFKPYLDAWLKQRRENDIESDWLFPLKSDPTQHLNAQTLNSWAQTFTRLLGVDFRTGKIRLLNTEYDGEAALAGLKGFNNLSVSDRSIMLTPYVNTTLLIGELINLKHDSSSGTMKLSEKSGARKDRYSSLSYNYWVSIQLENEMRKSASRSGESFDHVFMIRAPKDKLRERRGHY